MPRTIEAVTAEEKIANVFRRLSAKLQKEWDEGRRSRSIDLDDLTETLLAAAEELDPE